MQVLTPGQVDRIHQVTDALQIHRNYVIVPLAAHATGMELVMPDGKVLIQGPAAPAFDGWLEGLQGRLEGLELTRALRSYLPEFPRTHTPAEAPPGSSARRYMDWPKP